MERVKSGVPHYSRFAFNNNKAVGLKRQHTSYGAASALLTVLRGKSLTTMQLPKKESKQDEDCQKLIDPEQLENYLKQGWKYIAQVNGKVVVERNNH